jgi:hypothetical protein
MKPPYVGFVRIRTYAGQAGDVFWAAAHVSGVQGVGLVAGSFDVLAEAWSDSLTGLTDILLELNSLEGVRWSDSSLANIEDEASQA